LTSIHLEVPRNNGKRRQKNPENTTLKIRPEEQKQGKKKKFRGRGGKSQLRSTITGEKTEGPSEKKNRKISRTRAITEVGENRGTGELQGQRRVQERTERGGEKKATLGGS